MTKEQEADLNRAIAEYNGWTFTPIEGDYMVVAEHPDREGTPPDYTRSLDAIVPVVQRWIKKTEKSDFYAKCSIEFCSDQKACATFWNIYNDCTFAQSRNERPAIALCISFAKAARLEGYWK